MLYHKGEIYLIDVSQSVEHDHPMALDFLRRDCHNINEYFKRQGSHVLSTIKAFTFITQLDLQEDEGDFLKRLYEMENEDEKEAALQDAVFKQVYIPRTL